jgi:hypothetical protein
LDAKLASILAPPGGVYISDNFDRSGSDLGANWYWEYWGPGAGWLSTDGNNAHWNANGATYLGIWAHHVTPLNSDTQMASLVADTPGDATNEDPQHILIVRADASFDNFVIATIWHHSAEIGIIVSGSYTALGSASISPAAGARWELRAGVGSDARRFQLYMNDALVVNALDSGGTSAMGASNRYVGFGVMAGVQFFGFFFLQVAPPDVQGWAAADRVA